MSKSKSARAEVRAIGERIEARRQRQAEEARLVAESNGTTAAPYEPLSPLDLANAVLAKANAAASHTGSQNGLVADGVAKAQAGLDRVVATHKSKLESAQKMAAEHAAAYDLAREVAVLAQADVSALRGEGSVSASAGVAVGKGEA